MENKDLEYITMPLLRFDLSCQTIWHNALAQKMLIDPMKELLELEASTTESATQIIDLLTVLREVIKTRQASSTLLTLKPQEDEKVKKMLLHLLPEHDDEGLMVGVLAVAKEYNNKSGIEIH